MPQPLSKSFTDTFGFYLNNPDGTLTKTVFTLEQIEDIKQVFEDVNHTYEQAYAVFTQKVETLNISLNNDPFVLAINKAYKSSLLTPIKQDDLFAELREDEKTELATPKQTYYDNSKDTEEERALKKLMGAKTLFYQLLTAHFPPTSEQYEGLNKIFQKHPNNISDFLRESSGIGIAFTTYTKIPMDNPKFKLIMQLLSACLLFDKPTVTGFNQLIQGLTSLFCLPGDIKSSLFAWAENIILDLFTLRLKTLTEPKEIEECKQFFNKVVKENKFQFIHIPLTTKYLLNQQQFFTKNSSEWNEKEWNEYEKFIENLADSINFYRDKPLEENSRIIVDLLEPGIQLLLEFQSWQAQAKVNLAFLGYVELPTILIHVDRFLSFLVKIHQKSSFIPPHVFKDTIERLLIGQINSLEPAKSIEDETRLNQQIGEIYSRYVELNPNEQEQHAFFSQLNKESTKSKLYSSVTETSETDSKILVLSLLNSINFTNYYFIKQRITTLLQLEHDKVLKVIGELIESNSISKLSQPELVNSLMDDLANMERSNYSPLLAELAKFYHEADNLWVTPTWHQISKIIEPLISQKSMKNILMSSSDGLSAGEVLPSPEENQIKKALISLMNYGLSNYGLTQFNNNVIPGKWALFRLKTAWLFLALHDSSNDEDKNLTQQLQPLIANAYKDGRTPLYYEMLESLANLANHYQFSVDEDTVKRLFNNMSKRFFSPLEAFIKLSSLFSPHEKLFAILLEQFAQQRGALKYLKKLPPSDINKIIVNYVVNHELNYLQNHQNLGIQHNTFSDFETAIIDTYEALSNQELDMPEELFKCYLSSCETSKDCEAFIEFLEKRLGSYKDPSLDTLISHYLTNAVSLQLACYKNETDQFIIKFLEEHKRLTQNECYSYLHDFYQKNPEYKALLDQVFSDYFTSVDGAFTELQQAVTKLKEQLNIQSKKLMNLSEEQVFELFSEADVLEQVQSQLKNQSFPEQVKALAIFQEKYNKFNNTVNALINDCTKLSAKATEILRNQNQAILKKLVSFPQEIDLTIAKIPSQIQEQEKRKSELNEAVVDTSQKITALQKEVATLNQANDKTIQLKVAEVVARNANYQAQVSALKTNLLQQAEALQKNKTNEWIKTFKEQHQSDTALINLIDNNLSFSSDGEVTQVLNELNQFIKGKLETFTVSHYTADNINQKLKDKPLTEQIEILTGLEKEGDTCEYNTNQLFAQANQLLTRTHELLVKHDNQVIENFVECLRGVDANIERVKGEIDHKQFEKDPLKVATPNNAQTQKIACNSQIEQLEAAIADSQAELQEDKMALEAFHAEKVVRVDQQLRQQYQNQKNNLQEASQSIKDLFQKKFNALTKECEADKNSWWFSVASWLAQQQGWAAYLIPTGIQEWGKAYSKKLIKISALETANKTIEPLLSLKENLLDNKILFSHLIFSADTLNDLIIELQSSEKTQIFSDPIFNIMRFYNKLELLTTNTATYQKMQDAYALKSVELNQQIDSDSQKIFSLKTEITTLEQTSSAQASQLTSIAEALRKLEIDMTALQTQRVLLSKIKEDLSSTINQTTPLLETLTISRGNSETIPAPSLNTQNLKETLLANDKQLKVLNSEITSLTETLCNQQKEADSIATIIENHNAELRELNIQKTLLHQAHEALSGYVHQETFSPLTKVIYDETLSDDVKIKLLKNLTAQNNVDNYQVSAESITYSDSKITVVATPIHHAVEKGTAEMLQIILEGMKDFSDDKKNKLLNDVALVDVGGGNLENYTSSLHEAIRQGDLEKVKLLLEAGCSLDSLSSNMPPLLIAYHFNKIEIVKYLLTVGAEANVFDEEGNGLLHKAVLKGDLEMIDHLLTLPNLYIEPENNARQTPLYLAMLGESPEDVTYAIIRKLVNTSKTIHTEHLFANSPSIESLDYSKSLKYFPDKDNNTYLHRAILDEDYAFVVWLTKNPTYKHQLGYSNSSHETPLMLAVRVGNLETIKWLWYLPEANVNHINNEGKNALLVALSQLPTNNVPSEKDSAVINFILNSDQFDSEKLKQHNGHFYILKACINSNHIFLLQLINKGIDPNATNENHDTVLHVAASAGDFNMVKLLVEKSSFLHAQNRQGHTPLIRIYLAYHWNGTVSKETTNKIMDYLLEKTNEPNEILNKRDKEGNNLLDYAVHTNDIELVKKIVAIKAPQLNEVKDAAIDNTQSFIAQSLEALTHIPSSIFLDGMNAAAQVVGEKSIAIGKPLDKTLPAYTHAFHLAKSVDMIRFFVENNLIDIHSEATKFIARLKSNSLISDDEKQKIVLFIAEKLPGKMFEKLPIQMVTQQARTLAPWLFRARPQAVLPPNFNDLDDNTKKETLSLAVNDKNVGMIATFYDNYLHQKKCTFLPDNFFNLKDQKEFWIDVALATKAKNLDVVDTATGDTLLQTFIHQQDNESIKKLSRGGYLSGSVECAQAYKLAYAQMQAAKNEDASSATLENDQQAEATYEATLGVVKNYLVALVARYLQFKTDCSGNTTDPTPTGKLVSEFHFDFKESKECWMMIRWLKDAISQDVENNFLHKVIYTYHDKHGSTLGQAIFDHHFALLAEFFKETTVGWKLQDQLPTALACQNSIKGVVVSLLSTSAKEESIVKMLESAEDNNQTLRASLGNLYLVDDYKQKINNVHTQALLMKEDEVEGDELTKAKRHNSLVHIGCMIEAFGLANLTQLPGAEGKGNLFDYARNGKHRCLYTKIVEICLEKWGILLSDFSPAKAVLHIPSPLQPPVSHSSTPITSAQVLSSSAVVNLTGEQLNL